MNTPLTRTLQSLLLITALFIGSVHAQEGKFDIEPLASGMEPKVNINFGPAMMAGFAESMVNANPDLSTVLGGIKGLRLMVFEDLGDARELASSVDDAVDALVDGGWNRAIQVREDGEQIDLFMLESGDFVTGLVLVVRESSESAVLANIHGEMDPVLVGRLIGSGAAFDFDFEEMFEGAAND
jgi:hypothetical protein